MYGLLRSSLDLLRFSLPASITLCAVTGARSCLRDGLQRGTSDRAAPPQVYCAAPCLLTCRGLLASAHPGRCVHLKAHPTHLAGNWAASSLRTEMD